MTEERGGSGVVTAPLPLEELRALRSDWKDVPVPDLGDTVFRVYRLSGLGRAKVMTEAAMLLQETKGTGDGEETRDPAVVERVLLFEGIAVAASLGYPEEQWRDVLSILGEGAIETLYETVSDISKLNRSDQDKAKERLSPRRNAAAGTD